jgi:hypothetical protein
MQLDLKKIPFSRRLSRHMVYEETDNNNSGWDKGLYLALAAESGGFIYGGPAMGPKGFIRIIPTFDGKPQDYSYQASPFSVELKTDQGSVLFVLDGEKVLRIAGKGGIGLRLDGKLGFGDNAYTTERGAEFILGGTVYLFKALRGRVTLDCRWDRKGLKPTDPIVYIEPDENGEFSVAAYDTDFAYELPALAESLEQCIAEAEKDLNSFVAGLPSLGAEYKDFNDYAAYALWTGLVPFKGLELYPANKMEDQKIYSLEQAIIALTESDPSRALELLSAALAEASPQGLVPVWLADRQNLYEAVPPVYACTVNRLLAGGLMYKVAKEQLSRFYELMSKAVNWWLQKRTNKEGLAYYAYRYECGWQNELSLGSGLPSASCDLAAYLALAAESLAKIADFLGKSGESESWDKLCREQLDKLTRVLWDGERFKCINILTGEAGSCDGLLTLIPLILGKRLPEEITAVLAEKAKALDWDKVAIIPGALIIMGLKDSGLDAAARDAARKLIESCLAGGANDRRGKGVNAGAFYSPSACAALFAVGRTLQ